MEVLLVLIGLMLLTVFVVAIGDRIGLPWPALLTIITACAVFVPGLPQFDIPTELILPIFCRRCCGRSRGARPGA